jgi:hypothetical protein
LGSGVSLPIFHSLAAISTLEKKSLPRMDILIIWTIAKKIARRPFNDLEKTERHSAVHTV